MQGGIQSLLINFLQGAAVCNVLLQRPSASWFQNHIKAGGYQRGWISSSADVMNRSGNEPSFSAAPRSLQTIFLLADWSPTQYVFV